MARFPALSWSAAQIRESVFSRLAARLARHPGRVFPFYLGDTHLAPPDAARLSRLAVDEPAHYRYGAPPGEPWLLEALAEKCRVANRLSWVDRSCLVVTAGATQALAAAVRALLDPGDELIVCAPHWPLIRGITTNAGATLVEVELTQRLYNDPDADVAALLAPAIGERTRAIYFATPNNPDGKVLSPRALAAIADLACRHDLWVIADEVYEALVYHGEHASIAALPGMAERTVTAFSLSKSYALAGLRLGYLVGDPRVLHAVRKVANHTVYNVPSVLQRAGLAALEQGDEWIAATRSRYRQLRDAAASRLPLPLPDGGAYFFVDLSRHFRRADEDPLALFDRLLDGGVALAPGAQFGTACAAFGRLCFTALPEEELLAGIDRLAELLAAG